MDRNMQDAEHILEFSNTPHDGTPSLTLEPCNEAASTSLTIGLLANTASSVAPDSAKPRYFPRTMSEIQNLLVVRPLELRLVSNKCYPQGHKWWDRPANKEAALAYQRGELQPVEFECQECEMQRGPFPKCVRLEGYFKGACSNCKTYDIRKCNFYQGQRVPKTLLEVSPNQELNTSRVPNITHLTGIAKKMQKLPVVRTLAIKPGHKIQDPYRRSNREATLAYRRGAIPDVACEGCQSGGGLLLECVRLEGYFNGACGNCRIDDGQAGCSFFERLELHYHDVNPTVDPFSVNKNLLSGQIIRLR
ncbi:hypothetical protein BJ875DRAFT_274915 [Amylocarpus encephaloides]|uniref:Uncharacterized protein n=1 Tax=Amylocarpus encephaloides TaxID=45428 RepID=A0A9P7YSG5_9HELO|nr:hypothetical protein BJ875DRAFT_274915 [Amylocarpus encephaloides]